MLTEFQKEILKVLAQNRSEESFFAGGSVLNQHSFRMSEDFDIFHHHAHVCLQSFLEDVNLLREHGFVVESLRDTEKFHEVSVSHNGKSTRIQWVRDSAYRYFPVQMHDDFGFTLHYHDLVINKLLALAGRTKQRDFVDVCTIIFRGEDLTPYIWAACDIDPGYNPSFLCDHLLWNTRFQGEKWEAPFSLREGKEALICSVDIARERFAQMPVDAVGVLYLCPETGNVCWPENGRACMEHHARPYGSVPVFENQNLLRM